MITKRSTGESDSVTTSDLFLILNHLECARRMTSLSLPATVMCLEMLYITMMDSGRDRMFLVRVMSTDLVDIYSAF